METVSARTILDTYNTLAVSALGSKWDRELTLITYYEKDDAGELLCYVSIGSIKDWGDLGLRSVTKNDRNYRRATAWRDYTGSGLDEVEARDDLYSYLKREALKHKDRLENILSGLETVEINKGE